MHTPTEIPNQSSDESESNCSYTHHKNTEQNNFSTCVEVEGGWSVTENYDCSDEIIILECNSLKIEEECLCERCEKEKENTVESGQNWAIDGVNKWCYYATRNENRDFGFENQLCMLEFQQKNDQSTLEEENLNIYENRETSIENCEERMIEWKENKETNNTNLCENNFPFDKRMSQNSSCPQFYPKLMSTDPLPNVSWTKNSLKTSQTDSSMTECKGLLNRIENVPFEKLEELCEEKTEKNHFEPKERTSHECREKYYESLIKKMLKHIRELKLKSTILEDNIEILSEELSHTQTTLEETTLQLQHKTIEFEEKCFEFEEKCGEVGELREKLGEIGEAYERGREERELLEGIVLDRDRVIVKKEEEIWACNAKIEVIEAKSIELNQEICEILKLPLNTPETTILSTLETLSFHHEQSTKTHIKMLQKLSIPKPIEPPPENSPYNSLEFPPYNFPEILEEIERLQERLKMLEKENMELREENGFMGQQVRMMDQGELVGALGALLREQNEEIVRARAREWGRGGEEVNE